MKTKTVRTVSPSLVHFVLRSESSQAARLVAKLHETAQKVGFDDVGEVLAFLADGCKIEWNDPYAGLKAHARGFVVSGKNVASYLPLEIRGFTCLLPNGNPFHIGLCSYPKEIDLPWQRNFNTGLDGQSQWMNSVKTIVIEDCCVEESLFSHLCALSLLRKADDLGILRSVIDPYKQWKRFDKGLFTCQYQKFMDNHPVWICREKEAVH
jgi:hypothetical protein